MVDSSGPPLNLRYEYAVNLSDRKQFCLRTSFYRGSSEYTVLKYTVLDDARFGIYPPNPWATRYKHHCINLELHGFCDFNIGFWDFNISVSRVTLCFFRPKNSVLRGPPVVCFSVWFSGHGEIQEVTHKVGHVSGLKKKIMPKCLQIMIEECQYY